MIKNTLLLLTLSLTILAADFSPKKAIFTVNPDASKVVFDGHIGENEYIGGMQNFGVLTLSTPMLSTRQGSFYASMDETYLYLGSRTEVPDVEGVRLLSRYKKRDAAIYKDDCVEFLMMPPHGKGVYHIIVNPSGKVYDVEYVAVNGGVSASNHRDWNPKLETRSTVGKEFWELELRIPRKELELEEFKEKETFKMQFARTWRFPNQQCQLNQASNYVNPEEMCTVNFLPSTSTVRFIGMGNYRSGENEITFIVDNPTDAPRTITHLVAVTSEASPRNSDGEITVPPHASAPVVLKYTETARLNSEMNIKFADKTSGEVLYQRSLAWQYPVGKRWIAPERKDDCPLEFGVYPYHNLLRVRLGSKGEPLDLRKVDSVVFQIRDKADQAIGDAVQGTLVKDTGYTADLPLNLTQKGDYCIVAEITGKDGTKSSKKEQFKYEKFPWEHNEIGKERVVLSPYVPLEYGDDSVRTLMGEYTFKDGFFSSIRMGKAEELLASPVVLSVNGQAVRQKAAPVWSEKAIDRGEVTMAGEDEAATYSVRHNLEFDNFIKTTLTISPKGDKSISSMTLEIPLQTRFAQMLHATCNTMKYNATTGFEGQGDGVLWDSRQGKINPAVSNNFRPYIWVGNMAEGIAFFAQNDRNWSRNPELPMAELVRNGETTSLRIHFVDKPVAYSKPVEIVFGFQATPTRPRPAKYQQLTERFKAPNSIVLSCLAGGACWSCDNYDFYPKDHDYSYINAISNAKNQKGDQAAQDAFCDEFLKKHFSQYPKDRQGFFMRHLQRGFIYANMSNHIFPYLNVRASQLYWPEYQVFMDEWFCSQFRANNEDDYNNSPVPSYQDYALYCFQRMLREGLDGLYFDNIRDWNSPNMVTGPAYELPNEKIQPYFDIFDMRNLIKRTALMLQQEKKTIMDDRPLLVLHLTNTNIVPFSSLGTIGLDMEAHYGSADFQERFSEDYIKICTLGLQGGLAPEVLIQITGNDCEHVTRTFLAVTMAYDIPMVMNCGGLTSTWSKIWKALKAWGYGTEDVETFPCYAPSGRFECKSKDVRLAEYRHKDGSTILMVASFGAEGELAVTLPTDFKTAYNFEDDSPMSIDGNGACTVALKKNEFKIIRLK